MQKKFFSHELPYIVLGVGILLGLFRLRYFSYSDIPLGYDPGMYKEIFSHYRNVITSFDFSILPQWIRHEPLLGILAAFAHKLGISFDWMLTRGIGIINLIPGLLLFRRFKSTGKNLRWGVLAAFLYRTSIVQYQVFWSGYFKQTMGVSLMLLILILGEKKKLLRQSIVFFFLIILHKHTALYTGAILGIHFIVETLQNKQLAWKKILFRGIAGGLALLVYIPLRGRIMNEAVKAVGTGTGGDFINPLMYLKYSRPILILSLGGIWGRFRDAQKSIDVRMIGYGIGIVWIVFSLVNYNRTLVFLDVFVVIFAAYFLFKVFPFRSSLGMYVSFCLLLGWSVNYILYIEHHTKALISQEEFSSIKNLEYVVEPNALIMNTHRNYSPWIMGRSNREYINPGMSDNDLRTHQQWNQRRSVDGKVKCEMLKVTYAPLHRPVYLRLGSLQFPENLSGGLCFSLIRKGSSWALVQLAL